MHLSKQGIYDQLTSEYGEKFTEDEAEYAVDNVDADWNENALAKAKAAVWLPPSLSSVTLFDCCHQWTLSCIPASLLDTVA